MNDKYEKCEITLNQDAFKLFEIPVFDNTFELAVDNVTIGVVAGLMGPAVLLCSFAKKKKIKKKNKK